MNQTPQPIRVVLVDDHPMLLWGLSKLIDGERPRDGHVHAEESKLDDRQHAQRIPDAMRDEPHA